MMGIKWDHLYSLAEVKVCPKHLGVQILSSRNRRVTQGFLTTQSMGKLWGCVRLRKGVIAVCRTWTRTSSWYFRPCRTRADGSRRGRVSCRSLRKTQSSGPISGSCDESPGGAWHDGWPLFLMIVTCFFKVPIERYWDTVTRGVSWSVTSRISAAAV